MPTEKDRLGEKLHDLEKAREDQFFAERDRELIKKLREKQQELSHVASKAAESMGMLCPRCHRPLLARDQSGLKIMACPGEDGAWLDSAALGELLKGAHAK